MLHEAEVEHFHEIIVGTEPADQDVRGLEVAVDQTARVGLAERATDLAQQVYRPSWVHRSEFLHQSIDTQAIEPLHHVVEVAFFRHTEVIDLHRVNGAECGRGAGFTLEAPDERLTRPLTLPERAAAYELDRGRTRQQTVLRPPHFTHPTGANPLDQFVAADFTRVLQLQVDAVDEATDHIGQTAHM